MSLLITCHEKTGTRLVFCDNFDDIIKQPCHKPDGLLILSSSYFTTMMSTNLEILLGEIANLCILMAILKQILELKSIFLQGIQIYFVLC